MIQSTYKKLLDALPDNTHLGMVQYQDYSNLGKGIPTGNAMYPFMYKRKELEHEKEVRAFHWILGDSTKEGPINPEDLPEGIKVAIDIDKVVETIRVQPTNSSLGKGSNRESPQERRLGHEDHVVTDRPRTDVLSRCAQTLHKAIGDRISPAIPFCNA